ncbi:hypothetical protein BKA69DRAFT_1038048 [Paraphysoderma sedebokerense]|nr:hypothetical protein BKA69DRAFT_1038048 [Paraphysoderma sedebokerense]
MFLIKKLKSSIATSSSSESEAPTSQKTQSAQDTLASLGIDPSLLEDPVIDDEENDHLDEVEGKLEVNPSVASKTQQLSNIQTSQEVPTQPTINLDQIHELLNQDLDEEEVELDESEMPELEAQLKELLGDLSPEEIALLESELGGPENESEKEAIEKSQQHINDENT